MSLRVGLYAIINTQPGKNGNNNRVPLHGQQNLNLTPGNTDGFEKTNNNSRYNNKTNDNARPAIIADGNQHHNTSGAGSLPPTVNAIVSRAMATDFSGIPGTFLTAFVSYANAIPHTTLLQKINDSLYLVAYGSSVLSRKSKGVMSKTPAGLNFGFQWDVPFPLQGTTYYFMGTNGASKPYNIVLPQVWAGKELSKKCSVLLMIDFNQQYFINNQKLSEVTYFLAPMDTVTKSKSLYKVSGFGGTLSYSHKIYKQFSAALGINYTLNTTGLLDRQSINTYTRAKIRDSLFRIDKYFLEWQYINKTRLSLVPELLYDYKRFTMGISANVPLSNIAFYGNKKIKPVNAQLFIRWNLNRHRGNEK